MANHAPGRQNIPVNTSGSRLNGPTHVRPSVGSNIDTVIYGNQKASINQSDMSTREIHLRWSLYAQSQTAASLFRIALLVDPLETSRFSSVSECLSRRRTQSWQAHRRFESSRVQLGTRTTNGTRSPVRKDNYNDIALRDPRRRSETDRPLLPAQLDHHLKISSSSSTFDPYTITHARDTRAL